MDLRDIEYFAVIAEHRHLGRASEALNMGQPALSISLRRLERAARAKLVTRTTKGIELTAIGHALLAHVSRLRLARDDLAREIADLAQGQSGVLRVGSGPAVCDGFLPQVTVALLKSSPKVTLSVTVSATTETLLSALRAGKLDIVVNHMSQRSIDGLFLEQLWYDEFVVFAAASHCLAARKSVTLVDLTEEKWACTAASAFMAWQSLRQTFEDRGLPEPAISVISDSALLRHRVVAATNLLGIGSRRIVEANAEGIGIKIIPIKDARWIRPVSMVYRKDSYLPPVGDRFVEILKETAKDIEKTAPLTRPSSRRF